MLDKNKPVKNNKPIPPKYKLNPISEYKSTASNNEVIKTNTKNVLLEKIRQKKLKQNVGNGIEYNDDQLDTNNLLADIKDVLVSIEYKLNSLLEE